jgi:hypothetical protein
MELDMSNVKETVQKMPTQKLSHKKKIKGGKGEKGTKGVEENRGSNTKDLNAPLHVFGRFVL